MGLGFKGGMAAFAKGAEQGADRAREMENQDRNTAWLESQRKEKLDTQAREESTRVKMMQVGGDRAEAATQAGPGQMMPEGPEARMAPIQVKRPATEAEILTDMAAVQRGAGNAEGYLNSTKAATASVDAQRKKFDTDLADALAKGDADLITQVINGVGVNRVTGQVAINPFERDLPGYGKVPTFNATFKVQDPAGKVVEQTINSHDLQMRLQPYTAQMDTRLKVNEAGRWDKNYNRLGEQFKQTHGLAERTADRQDESAAMKLQTDTLAYEKALEEHKVPTAVKQQVEILRDELKTIATAQAKAQAEGNWTADNPGAKVQGERQMVANEQLRTLLTPYMPKAGAVKAQPFGEPKGNEPTNAIPKMAPISYTDKVWGEAEPAAAQATGVPIRVLQSVRMQGERSNGDQISAKGARGVYQFTPSSRDAFLKKYGVDAYSADPKEQALAAAWHLKESFDRTGNWNQAMAGFNGGISGENGTNTTAENKSYAERTRIAGMPTSAPK